MPLRTTSEWCQQRKRALWPRPRRRVFTQGLNTCASKSEKVYLYPPCDIKNKVDILPQILG